MTVGLTRRNLLAGSAALGLGLSFPRAGLAAPVAELGARKVHVLSDGGFTLPLSMLVRGRQPEEVMALLKAEGMPTDMSHSVLNVSLIQDGAEFTIIDCGSGANFMPGAGKLAANLEAAGINRDAVKRVLFTHAHPDHLWGALDDFDTDLFPNATYQISEAEWAFWTDPAIYSKLPEDRAAFAAGAQRILKAIGEKTTRFKPGQEVAPGILAVDTAGHTPGHVAFEVAGGGKTMMILGDCLTHKAISFAHPDWRSGSDTDPDQGIATRKKLLDRLAADQTSFIGYHLPVPGLGRAARKAGAYRFEAL
jgi:glyoxylase-like metal-dependent hydrolase (beta-lactamase superfamily II)